MKKAEQEIDKAAAARGIKLTAPARQALAREAVHQEATASTPDSGPVTGALSNEKLSNLLTPLSDAPQGTKLDAREVETRITNHKTKQVVATLPADIDAHARASGKSVPDEVRAKMMEDLTKQSDALSKSGLAVGAIRLRNEATLRAIDQAVGTGPITPQSYQRAMTDIFTRQVELSILSTPEGADVSTAGYSIGRTNITGKQFKPGSYAFTFRLSGYVDAEREFYVTPGEDADSFTQALTPVSNSGLPTGGRTSEPDGSRRNGGFPWGYSILGGIIVVLVVALVARRR